RTFDARDRTDSPGVAVVNATFAKQYFDSGDPIGHRIAFAGRERQIVGVVGDVQLRPGWGDNGPLAPMPLAYVPISQASAGMLRLVHGWFSPAFIVRSSTPVNATVAAIRRAVEATDPWLPLARVRSMTDVQAASLAPQRFSTVLLSVLALS